MILNSAFFSLIAFLSLKPQLSESTFHPECYTKEGLTADQFYYFDRLPDSKYGAMPDLHVFNIDSATQWCADRDMQLARIKTKLDYKSINSFLIGNKANCEGAKIWWIQGTDNDEEGVWKYSDGSNMTFQAFYALEPTNAAKDAGQHANYLIMVCAHRPTVEGPQVAYLYRDRQSQQQNGEYETAFFCEFHETSPCWINSIETKRNQDIGDGLEHIGDGGDRSYHIAKQMKTWHQAKEYCKENEMELLDLEFEDEKAAEETYNVLGKFIRSEELLSLGVSFILAGKFSKLFSGDRVPFDWEWIDNKWRDKNDYTNSFFYDAYPGYQGQMLYGKCMAVGIFYKWTDTPKYTLTMAHCNVPHWAVCFKKI